MQKGRDGLGPPPTDPHAAVARALDLATDDPSLASSLARAALSRAGAAGDAELASCAHRALGLAARERRNLRSSAAHLRRAVAVAEEAGLERCAGEARLSLVGTLALQGDSAGALAEADRAVAGLTGALRARAETQRAHVHLLQGRLPEAFEGFGRALPVLRRAHDRLGEARLYDARAMAHHLRGSVNAAEADLRRAEALFDALGQRRNAAAARLHLGLSVARRGDIPEALRWFDRAEEYSHGSVEADAMGLIDRSEVLLGARLISEARAAAELAVKALAGTGERAYLAIARLKLAETALAAGDVVTARAVAEQARRAFVRQDRPSWAALARHVAVRSARAEGRPSAATLAAAANVASELAAAGFASSSMDARTLAAHVALDLGRLDDARRQLAEAGHARTRGPVQVRVRAWHAEALLRLADGNLRGAQSALLAGVRLIDRYRAALGATELRVHASGHAADLTGLGLHLAVTAHDAARALEWAERWRAACLRLRPARPPEDRRLAGALSELRAVAHEVEVAALSGKPTGALLTRQAHLEDLVRSRARHATGVLAAAVEPPPTAAAVVRSAGDNALVELIEDGGRLWAAVVAGGTTSLHDLCPAEEATQEQDRLMFALRRLATGRASTASLAAAADAMRFGAKRLDDLLLAPFADRLADRPVVVVPTGRLHSLPWSTLPSWARRAVTVAPSAALWLRANAGGPRHGGGGVTLVAGPGLVHAGPEVAALARRYRSARRLTGARATAARVLSALDGAGLAHVAAHGTFRADNPLFSSLHLADGPLTVYDLERLHRAPDTLILSACDSGLSDVQPGDELMGLASALFTLGTRTLVASVFPVPDASTRRMMAELHRGLARGAPAAAALTAAQTRSAKGGPSDVAAAAAFVCFGAGHAPLDRSAPAVGAGSTVLG